MFSPHTPPAVLRLAGAHKFPNAATLARLPRRSARALSHHHLLPPRHTRNSHGRMRSMKSVAAAEFRDSCCSKWVMSSGRLAARGRTTMLWCLHAPMRDALAMTTPCPALTRVRSMSMDLAHSVVDPDLFIFADEAAIDGSQPAGNRRPHAAKQGIC